MSNVLLGLTPESWASIAIGIAFVLLSLVGFLFLISRFYRKVGPEEAIVRSGWGGLEVATGEGIFVIPFMHIAERMDLSVKRIEIRRSGVAGLICRDNIRADIEVAFFVRVNNQREEMLTVAQNLGCKKASDQAKLIELFDAKFSEALKTVGKRFDFVELYNERDKFKEEIVGVIGDDLNGYVLEDCAIDFLEQTPLAMLNPDNILDAEGIKKITELTAGEHVLSNHIEREKQKTIRKQDVEAREAILELDRQQAEAEEKQQREIAEITAREQAEAARVQEEERLKAESARIRTEEELQVAEENKQRQIIVALRNRERTDKVETERVERDRMLEATERERVVALADIEKDKAVEVEKRSIQEVIRERVMVERAVVEEQERIKDTEEFAGAERLKKVAITGAEMDAEQKLVMEVKDAEAKRTSASLLAEQVVIAAEADRDAAEKKTLAAKMLAEARTAEEAAGGLAEAQVEQAKAEALERTGTAEANVSERKAVAQARGVEALAAAKQKDGTAEAEVMRLKYSSEAQGIQEKAESMKLFDEVGRDHEEFKLRLNKEKDIEIAAIAAQREIAEAQSGIVGEALKSARIDIVGGETEFFDKIVDSIKSGKAVDRFVNNSQTVTDVKNTFFNGNPEYFEGKLRDFVGRFNVSTDDIKDLTVAALIVKLMGMTTDDSLLGELNRMLGMAAGAGVANQPAASTVETVE